MYRPGKADEHCARLELGRRCSVVRPTPGTTSQLGRSTSRCGLERWQTRQQGRIVVGRSRLVARGRCGNMLQHELKHSTATSAGQHAGYETPITYDG